MSGTSIEPVKLPLGVSVVCVVAPAQGAGPAAEEAQEIDSLSPFSSEDTAWLAARGWLSQDLHMRGSYVVTDGLDDFGLPELGMLNVPACFLPAAVEVVSGLARWALAEGVVHPGQVVDLEGAPARVVLVEEAGGELEALRVVPLI